ncbi:MAG: LuxR C-terminal-related transcriptional regulator [Acidimicrobiales bacterium]
MASWVASLQMDTAWLRLDEADQDPARFGRHVAETVNQAINETLPGSTAAALGAGATVAAANRVTPLLNHLAYRDRPLHLVLDDYHYAASPDIDEVARYLITHAPQTLRLCFTSRAQPDLQLTRLRASGDLAELTLADLALDRAETGELVAQITGVDVSLDDAANLCRATEGWPVMVALAAHAMAARGDIGVSKIPNEASRELDSYVLEEVLASLGDEEIDFVRTTSILEQLSGPLVDAVRDQPGGGAKLAALTRSGFPLEQLDTSRPWYRYHQHVANTLREDLSNTFPGTDIDILHQRAAAWLEANGQPEAALEHALRGRDDQRAARLIGRQWLALVNQGQLGTVRRWLSQLPNETVEADPALGLATAWTNLMAGELDTVSPFLAAARSFDGDEPPLPGASSIASGVALIETIYYRVIGRLSDACDSAEVALEQETEPDAAGRARALAYAGICRFWKGQFDHATRLLNHAAGVADRFDQRMARLLALGYLGLIEAEQSTEGLRAIVTDAETVIEEAQLHLHPSAAPALAANGLLAMAEDRPGDALAKLEDALAVASIQAEPGLLAYLNLACAKALETVGRNDDADRRRRVADALCRRAEDVGFVAARCGASGGEQVTADVALTGREIAVLQLLSSSLTLPQIAGELFVSHNTVKTHVQSLYRKLGVTKRVDAVRVAATLGVS